MPDDATDLIVTLMVGILSLLANDQKNKTIASHSKGNKSSHFLSLAELGTVRPPSLEHSLTL